MFQVGDKVVYPVHGAGVIESIERREVMGEERTYYVLVLPVNEMRVLVPTDNAEPMGIRPVVDNETVEQVLTILRQHQEDEGDKWNRRYRLNMDKIRSGDICAVAEVVRNLTRRDISKGLSTSERKLLEQSRDILVSELILVRNAKAEEILAQLDDIFHNKKS